MAMHVPLCLPLYHHRHNTALYNPTLRYNAVLRKGSDKAFTKDLGETLYPKVHVELTFPHYFTCNPPTT